MDTARAREELGWRPAYDARETLRETIAGARRVPLGEAGVGVAPGAAG